MLPWLMERGEVPVAEMAARFELTEAELVGDLELAALCGLPPFIDEMIDVFIDEGVVFAGVPRLFTKPLRLTAPEGFALLTAGTGGDAAARRRSRRLAGAGARQAGRRARRRRGGGRRAAAAGDSGSGRRRSTTTPDCAIRYWSAGRDEVDRARDHAAVDLPRSRQLVRDRRRQPLGRTSARSASTVSSSGNAPAKSMCPNPAQRPSCRRPATSGSPTATCPSSMLRLAPQARWAAERYPAARATAPDDAPDASVVRMAVASEQWLRTLLLRLGPHAEVLEPAEWHDLGADAGPSSCWRATRRRRQLIDGGDAVRTQAGGGARPQWRRHRRAHRAAGRARSP